MEKILVLEPLLTGHHFKYIEWLMINNDSIKFILVSTQNVEEHKNLDEFLKRNIHVTYYENKIDFSKINSSGFLGLIKRENYVYTWLQSSIEIVEAKEDFSHIFLPSLDLAMYRLACTPRLFENYKFSGIVIRPNFHFSEMNAIGPKKTLLQYLKKYLFLLLLRKNNVSTIFLIDPLLSQYINEKYTNIGTTKYLEDPVNKLKKISKLEALKFFAISTKKPIFLMFGAISFRKGLKSLFEAKNNNKNIFLMLVGKQDEVAKSYINEQCIVHDYNDNDILIIDKYVSDLTEAYAYSACDAVWLNYIDHYGMSGVLMQLSELDIPFYPSDKGLIGWYVSNFGKKSPAQFLNGQIAYKFKNNIFDAHSVENFKIKISKDFL